MKAVQISWTDVQVRTDLERGTIEVYRAAIPNYPWNSEMWESRYYRGVIEKVEWVEGLPLWYLGSVTQFEESGRQWVPGMLPLQNPLRTDGKEIVMKVEPWLLENGTIFYHQSYGRCLVFPKATIVAPFPDTSHEEGAEKLLEELFGCPKK